MKRTSAVVLLGIVAGFGLMKAGSVSASPAFLNRHAYPHPLVLNEIGPFHKNYLRTFVVSTQWSNESDESLAVKIAFVVFDSDAANAQVGEDGKDDPLMTVIETFTIPKQSSYWARTFSLIVIGGKLNQGFDHPSEGAALELYVDAQILSVHAVADE